MGTQRITEFETTSDQGADRVSEALAAAFGVSDTAHPDDVPLACWRIPGGRPFLALIELAEEGTNMLLGVEATRVLPHIIGECVDVGYPGSEIVVKVGSFGFDL